MITLVCSSSLYRDERIHNPPKGTIFSGGELQLGTCLDHGDRLGQELWPPREAAERFRREGPHCDSGGPEHRHLDPRRCRGAVGELQKLCFWWVASGECMLVAQKAEAEDASVRGQCGTRGCLGSVVLVKVAAKGVPDKRSRLHKLRI